MAYRVKEGRLETYIRTDKNQCYKCTGSSSEQEKVPRVSEFLCHADDFLFRMAEKMTLCPLQQGVSSR